MKSNITTYEGFKNWFAMSAHKLDQDTLRSYLNSFKVHNAVDVLGVEMYGEEIELCKNLLNET